MSGLGFVMLCHTALHRAADVARHWAERGCPVVIHVDKRVSTAEFEAFQHRLSDLKGVSFAPRRRCEWGTWSLVAAAQAASEQLLATFPDVRHVFHVSGSCLPLRPVEELQAYLAARPHTDFIESVTSRDVDWTVGGLNVERFKYRFPFSWKRQRRLFDGYVNLQRWLGFRRRLPEGVTPHLGSQWWCLTRQTLTAILEDPRRRELERFFKLVWIPDESYFQTLVRMYGRTVESRSLTLSKFDFQGKPHVFYDDHLHLLRRSDCFVARKIWPKANRLYDTFLGPAVNDMRMSEPSPGKIDRVFVKAMQRRTRGRRGLYMQSRFPNWDWENGKTAAPYAVFQGFNEVFEDFEDWLGRRVSGTVHGNLFDPKKARFAGDANTYAGCLPASAELRDYNPERFLTNLIWNARGERQSFQFSARDTQKIGPFLARDGNATISVITGAWAIPLYKSNRNFADIRADAAVLQKREVAFINTLRHVQTRADVRVWTLAEFLEDPMHHVQQILEALDHADAPQISEAPKLTDLSSFPRFLQALKNQGMNIATAGEFPDTGPEWREPLDPKRPYLVR